LEELRERGLATATPFRVKEFLCWVLNADSKRYARLLASRFFEYACEPAGVSALPEPVCKALNTLQEHLFRFLRRRESLLLNARLKGLNGHFKAVRP
jgi:hypothetical protein